MRDCAVAPVHTFEARSGRASAVPLSVRYQDLADGDVGVFVETGQELGVVEVVVEAAGGNQFVVGASFDDVSRIHHENRVCEPKS